MSSLDTPGSNPQLECPLYTILPAELRNTIFDLAITPSPHLENPLPKDHDCYRPHFRHHERRLSTAVLRTCKRIHTETAHLPQQNHEIVLWFENGPSKPAYTLPNLPKLTRLHLFTQQYWLESWKFEIPRLVSMTPMLKHLTITMRYTDWWNWASDNPDDILLLDAKWYSQATKSMFNDTGYPSRSGFLRQAWGSQFQCFEHLETLELELETIAQKKDQLDRVVAVAKTWQFPLDGGNASLVLDPRGTRRKGWVGAKLGTIVLLSAEDAANEVIATGHASSIPQEEKQDLIADGVDFSISDCEPEIRGEELMVYYVVSLTYRAVDVPAKAFANVVIYDDDNFGCFPSTFD